MQEKVFLNHKATDTDIRCVLLARLGFSYKLIEEQTGLSTAQVSYRLNKLDVRITDYRDGQSELAIRIVDAVHVDSAGIGMKIRQLLQNRAEHNGKEQAQLQSSG